MNAAERANALVEVAKHLAQVVESWADFSNVMFNQHTGLVGYFFPTGEQRVQFYDSEGYKQIQQLKVGLMNKFGLAGGAIPRRRAAFVSEGKS
jgi:hypothetical protein